MFERFTKDAREAVIRAQLEARDLGHTRIGTEHVLLGLLVQDGTVSAQALAQHTVGYDQVRDALDSHRRELRGHIPFSPRAKKCLELALREAIALKHRRIWDGHLLLGILREGEGLGVRVLTDAKVDLRVLRHDVIAAMPAFTP